MPTTKYNSAKNHKSYLLSFHGTDIGLSYNLPQNVRVILYCLPGKEVSAVDINEIRTWKVATTSTRDAHGKYLAALKIYWDNKKYPLQYCVFSGNLKKQQLHKIPDLLLDTEFNDFKTGLFQLPVRFQRVFLKDHYSITDKRYYQPGEVSAINVKKLHKQLKLLDAKLNRNDEIYDKSFMAYLLKPGQLNKKKYSTLNFVVVPNSKYYSSYSKLKTDTSKITRPSIANSTNAKDKQVVKNIIKQEKGKEKGLYLSDVIQHAKKENPGKFITIIAAVCRAFHPALTKNLRTNQSKTEAVTIDEYLQKYAKIDLETT